MDIKEIKTNIISTTPDKTIPEAAQLMADKDIGSLIVQDNNNFVGIITERDILRKVVAKSLDVANTTVKDIMSNPLITINENAHIEDANDLMIKNKIRRLVVTKDGKPNGIVSQTDIIRNMRYLLGKSILNR